MKKKIIVIILFLSIIVLAILGRKRLVAQNNDSTQTTVQQGDVIDVLTLSGTLDAEEKVTLHFQTAGLMSWIGVKEGDSVKKYQAIASLDQRDLKKKLQKELNDYLKYRWDFEQKKDDYKDKPLTAEVKRIVDKAQFDVNNSVIDVELKDISRRLSTIKTPISGIVTHIDTPYSGVNVVTTDKFEIVNPETIYFQVVADQTEVVQLKEGKQTTIVFDSYPDEKTSGTITHISYKPKEGETDTVYEVKVHLNSINDSTVKYRIGMTGDADFTISEKHNVLYISPQYIKEDDKGTYVLKGEKKEKVYIQTGIESDDRIEITSTDLDKGDIVHD